jgi:uncharacterized protein
MAYIDSNVFIYPVIYSPETEEKSKKAKELLLKVENGEMKAYTSTLTWDEVVYVVARTMDWEEGTNIGRKLLGFPNLEFIDVDKLTLSMAQSLIDRYHIRPRDSIHIASALNKNVKTIISDDKDFDKVAERKRPPLL